MAKIIRPGGSNLNNNQQNWQKEEKQLVRRESFQDEMFRLQKQYLSDTAKAKDLKRIIDNSKTEFEVYQKYSSVYPVEELVAIGLFSWQEIEKYKFINNNKDEISFSGTYNSDAVNETAKEFQAFLANHSEYRQIDTLSDDDANLKLPNLYLFGSQDELKILNAMSLPTKTALISNHQELVAFKNDNKNKAVLFSKHANANLAGEYNQIFEEQNNFETYQLFGNNQNSINPFTRQKLIEIILSNQ